MTNESNIIIGFCQSILMNLSFHKQNWGGGAGPPVNYRRYAYARCALRQVELRKRALNHIRAPQRVLSCQ